MELSLPSITEAGQETMKPGACEIEHLPEELLALVISLTAPVVACCAAAVSSAFRAAADSDAVWSRFLPRDLPLFAKKELPLKPLSRKGLFLRLADQPALLPHKFIRMQLDKATGTKCFALCARSLQFSRVVSREWCWNHLGFDHNTRGKKFLEVAVFPCVCRFEICGKIHRNMLSQNSTYAAYMVFKISIYEYFGWDVQLEEASVTVGGHELTRRVCLACYDDNQVPPTHVTLTSTMREEHCAVSDLGEDVVVSRRRPDGWMEVELGEFHNEGNDADGEVLMSLKDTNGGTYKEDFIVRSIEVRTKHGS